MALEKIYTPIGWQNKPSTATPLGSHNLSKIDEALAEIDERVVELSEDTEELDGRVEDAETDIAKNADDITSLDNRFAGFSVAVSQGMQVLSDRVDEAEAKIEKNTEDINALKIIPTASGSPVYIFDASNMGFEGIDTFGESTQNGTPTPTSPIPIESKVVNRVVVSGKNLFGFGESAIDKTTELRPLAYQRLIFTKIDDNTIKCNYTDGTYATGFVEISGIDGTKNYAISFVNKENSLGYTPRIEKYASHCTEDKLVLSIYSGSGNNVISSDNYFILSNIQVELDTTATSFEPYKPIQTVNLSTPIELNGIGGVRDTDKLKNIYVKVFTGNESFRTYTPGVGGVQFGCEDENIPQIESENVLCTHLPPKFTWNVREDGIAITSSSSVVVRFRMESLGISTVEDLKAKLKEWYDAGNPMVLYAPIKTPEETTLPQADIDAIKNLHTYKPNTVVMNDADAEMDVSYVADPRLYIDRKFETLASAIVNQ